MNAILPEIVPEVMARIMPPMLPRVAPLIAPKMTATSKSRPEEHKMSCYFRHMKEVLAEAGIEVTPASKKQDKSGYYGPKK